MAVGAMLMAASAGFKILGALQQAQVTKKLSSFFADQADINADIALQQGAADEAVLDRQQQFRRGAIAGKYAAGGVEVGVGSPLQVLMEQARLDSYQRIRRGYDAQLQARNLEVSAASARYRGSVALQQGVLSALGAATEGAENIYGAGGFGSSGSSSSSSVGSTQVGRFNLPGSSYSSMFAPPDPSTRYLIR